MIQVSAPSRLHFGLLNPFPDPRMFGGVGLMLRQPGLAVCVEAADAWSASGPLADRALAYAKQVVATIPEAARSPLQVVVESTPSQHIGLGVGTQLGLAVGRAVALQAGLGPWPATALATRIGRGRRSAIGVHGFDHGGLIVEAGKRNEAGISPLIGAYPWPADWRVLLLMPLSPGQWYGQREQAAFDQLQPGPEVPQRIATMSRRILTELIPALLEQDLAAFATALEAYNQEAGAMFAHIQGGNYASRHIEATIQRLRTLGIRGVGQSSWGPTVFGILSADEAEARRLEFTRLFASDYQLQLSEGWAGSLPTGTAAPRLASPGPV